MADEKVVLTPEGHKRMVELLEHLKTEHREELRERMKNVQKSGEVSEDPEYEEIKKEYAMLESRIQATEAILQSAVVLDAKQISTDRVGIGSRVKVQNLKTKSDEMYTILSTMEANPEEGRISDVCPVGRALMRAKKGDVVNAMTPVGRVRYLIKDIAK